MFEEGKNENAASPGEDDSYEVLTSIENEQKTKEEGVKMKKKKKSFSLKRLLCGILCGVILLVILLLIFLGPVICFCVETFAPHVIGVPVTVRKVETGIFRGYFRIKNIKIGDSKGLNAEQFVHIDSIDLHLKKGFAEVRHVFIANPEGYRDKYLLTLEHARLDLDISTLDAEKLRIEELLARGADFYFEPGIQRKSNVDALQEYVKKTFKIPESKEESVESDAKKIQIDKLSLTEIKVHTIVMGSDFEATVIPIELDNLGTGPEGITGGEIFLVILDKLTFGATTALREMFKDIGSGTEQFFNDTGKKFKSLFE